MAVDVRGAPQSIDVQALGCDFLRSRPAVARGVGALWGRRELLEQMQPFNLGGEMIRSVSLERTSWNELPYKFEAGTPAIAEAYGFGIALDYVSAVGLEKIEEHEHELVVQAIDRLSEIPGIRIRPAGRRTGIVNFELERSPHDVAQILNWKVSPSAPPPLHAAADGARVAPRPARASTCTRPRGVDRLIAGLHGAETFA
jgi:cysteine desulfurase/selenocysteine lyase